MLLPFHQEYDGVARLLPGWCCYTKAVDIFPCSISELAFQPLEPIEEKLQIPVQKDSDTTRDFYVTVEALSGTAQGEEKVNLLYIFHHCGNRGVIATILH